MRPGGAAGYRPVVTAIHLERWRDRAGTVDVSPLSGVGTGRVPCLFVTWSTVDEDTQDLAMEQLGPDAQDGVLAGELTPFAVLGSTEESGEELTLENVLDTQIDGILLYDKDFVVHVDADGALTRQAVTVDGLAVTLDDE